VDDLPLKAARAITLALRSDGGDVHGLLFAGSAWHTEGINAETSLALSRHYWQNAHYSRETEPLSSTG